MAICAKMQAIEPIQEFAVPQKASQVPFGKARPRLAREWKTMNAMVRCYCHDVHGSSDALCPECQSLLDYATVRLDRCRFGEEKPTCANCPVHCYQKERREQIKVVMRNAGPRMIWKHPILSLMHMLDGRLRRARL